MDTDTQKTPRSSPLRILTEDVSDGDAQVTFTEKRPQPKEVDELHGVHSERDGVNGKTSFDVEGAYNESSIQLGTIVTDKRKKRQSFGSMLHSAFDEWLNTTKKKVKDTVDQHEFLKQKEVPKIEVAEFRKDVIQEAAQYAKQAPRDDHAIVLEKIRTLAHDAEVATGKPFLFKPPSATHKDVSWKQLPQEKQEDTLREGSSSLTPVAALLPKEPVSHSPQPTKEHARSSLASYAEHFSFSEKGHDVQPVPAFSVSPIAKKLSPKVPAPRVQSVPIPHPKHTPERTDLRSLLAPSITKHADAPLTPSDTVASPHPPSKNPDAAPKHRAPLPTLPPIPIPAPEKAREEKRPLVLTPVRAVPPRVPQHHVNKPARARTVLLTSIAVVGASLGIFVAFLVTDTVMLPSDPAPVARTMAVPAFLTTDSQIPVPLPGTRKELLETLVTELERASGGVLHTYPVITTDSGSVPATTDEIMEVLSPHAAGSFLRSLSDDLMLGSVGTGQPQPFIVLRSSNFDVAFAGMLDWEHEMSGDLAPLFGAPVLATLPPVGSLNATTPRFIDALASNRSIRILYDESGAERIVYAFVNSDIIITTTTEALAVLVERIP